MGLSHCGEPPLGQEWMAGPSFPASMQGCCLVWEVHSGVHTDVPSLPPFSCGAIYISRPLTQLCAHLNTGCPLTAPFLEVVSAEEPGEECSNGDGGVSSTESRARGDGPVVPRSPWW